ncbi:MAG: class I SAM-dependent methyltransferase [Crocinitomicaceae bacterium]|nr:class I SAM-dependent methyltransferase [Crocinitomicaceae bacterium]
MSAIFETRAFVSHLLKARGKHSVHSPYVFDLLTKVLPRSIAEIGSEKIELLRKEFVLSNEMIEVVDFGAGSRMSNDRHRSLSSIAKKVAGSKKQAHALASIAKFLQPKVIIELGTSLGFTTAYIAEAAPSAKVWTMEGAPAIAALAEKNFRSLDIENIEVVTGAFSETLESVLEMAGMPDLVIMDGHHLYQPTVNYFGKISKRIKKNGVVILDDIHWSKQMEKAWDEVSLAPEVGFSIDFFDFGMLVFRTDVEKQHFVLRLP